MTRAGDVEPTGAGGSVLEKEQVEAAVVEDELGILPAGGLVGQADVGRFTQGVLAGIDASYLHVEGIAAVAGADDHGSSGELPEGFEDGAAELLQGRDALQGDGVVDAVGPGHLRASELC